VKKVAVTGASGHLGANLVRELIQRGYQVRALVRKSSKALANLDVDKVSADVRDLPSLCKAFKDIEQVYHLAAYISIQAGDIEKLQLINVEGTGNVIKACHSQQVATLVYFSSIHALDQHPLDKPVTEDNSLLEHGRRSATAYELSKARADKLVRAICSPGLSTRIIYPSGVLGPNDFNLSLMGLAILKLAQGRLPALVDGGFDWVDARDVACGAIEAAEKGSHGSRFILSGNYLKMSEVARVVSDLSGTPSPGFICPVWLAKLFAPVMTLWARIRGETPLYTRESLTALSANSMISHSRATELLDYHPRPFRRSMQDALDFYTRQNHLPIKGDRI
jgi:dihydroflavonol-4-reductase